MGWGCEGPRAAWRWHRPAVLDWGGVLGNRSDRPVVAAMIYGSVCSGIEAASQAWHPLGWKPAFFSEIDKFPSAVLAHHYGSNMPDEPVSGNGVPNYGDMTDFERWPDHAIDILVGGTPCQDYSLAGLRKGMAGDRGSLTLTFIKIAARYRPKWLVWENVPGVLSSNDGRDFARFLGDITGTKIDVPKDGWRNSGIVAGIPDAYGVAYVVRDAQFVRVDGFGRAVPQRRRRVFVVGYIGDWRCAAAVLFEPESMQGNSEPCRKAGQGIAADVAPSLRGCGVGSGRVGDTRGQGPVVAARMVAFGEYVDDGTASTIKQRDHKDATDLVAAKCFPINTQMALRGGETSNSAREGLGLGADDDPAFTLQAQHHHAIAFKPSHYTRGKDGAPSEVFPPLSADADNGDQDAVVFAPHVSGAICRDSFAGGAGGRPEGAAAGHFLPVAFDLRGRDGGAMPEGPHDTASIRASSGGSSRSYVAAPWAVRRLTPIECERLQGFPDDHTRISWRGKPAAQCPDGPRYKALGNSMAVNVMRWIGRRIEMIEGIING